MADGALTMRGTRASPATILTCFAKSITFPASEGLKVLMQMHIGKMISVPWCIEALTFHYSGVTRGAMASQITNLTIIYSTVYSGADQRKQQSSALLAICARNSPVTGEFPAQRASNAENVSIWWRHHIMTIFSTLMLTCVSFIKL